MFHDMAHNKSSTLNIIRLRHVCTTVANVMPELSIGLSLIYSSVSSGQPVRLRVRNTAISITPSPTLPEHQFCLL